MPKYKHRQLATITHFIENMASESKYNHCFKIKPLTDTMNAAFQQSGIMGKYLSRGGMTVKFYGHNASFVGNHERLVVNYGLFVYSWALLHL
jgi:hypothetical protein